MCKIPQAFSSSSPLRIWKVLTVLIILLYVIYSIEYFIITSHYVGRSKYTIHQKVKLLDANTDKLWFVCVGDTYIIPIHLYGILVVNTCLSCASVLCTNKDITLVLGCNYYCSAGNKDQNFFGWFLKIGYSIGYWLLSIENVQEIWPTKTYLAQWNAEIVWQMADCYF